MGTPEYAVPYLEGLIQAGMKPVAVLSQPDRSQGRKQIVEPTPVKKFALSYDISVLQPEDIRMEGWTETIRELAPDVIVVVAFGQIIPRTILDIPPKGCVNVHPSLLPKYRGAAPLQEAILHDEKETGVSIMLMDEKMDHGPILAQEKMPLAEDETLNSLRKKTTAVGVPLLVDTLTKLLEGRLTPKPQDDSQASYTQLLTRESGRIDWSRPARKIECQVRALNPWPGTWTEWNGKRLKILKIRVADEVTSTHAPLGELFAFPSAHQLFVPCGKGEHLEITELQPEGKKPMSAKEFLNGGYLAC